jgi:two-component system, NarL family, nitrate/nitrite response regulator NarL
VALRCLIVDDSEEFLSSAARLLESQGVEVVACATAGAEAMRLAETLEPDVTLVDIELGDEDGIALAQKLAGGTASNRVLLISARERDDLGDLLLQRPAVRFLPKSALGAAAIERMLD